MDSKIDRWVTFAVVVYVVNVLLWVFVLCMSGCYLEHEAEPCAADGGESYVLPDSSTVEHVTVNHGDVGSSPALAAVCAGPLVQGECYRNVHDWVSNRGER